MPVELKKLQKTACVLLRSQCDRFNESLTSERNLIPKVKLDILGMIVTNKGEAYEGKVRNNTFKNQKES